MMERASRSPRAAAVDLTKTLQNAGHVAWFAGGCVRDELLGITPKDWDIATDATPEQVKAIFPRARAVGEAFGVMLVLRHHHPTEIATFRTDGGYSDGRRPDGVVFSDAQSDAQRRDFTINGLFRDPVSGALHDFVGGQADLEARRLRAIGDAGARFEEDDLRMLRAVRFAASLDLEVDPATDAAIRARAGSLGGVSRERIGDEVRRMLSHDSRVRAVQLIQEWSLDKAIFGDDRHASDWVRLSQVGQDVPLMPALLAAWALDRGAVTAQAPDEAAAWRSALLLTNAETKGFESCLMTRTRLDEWKNLDVAGRKRLASSRWFSAALSVAAREVPDDAAAIAADVQMLEETGLAPDRLVTGDDLLADGLHAGPALGRILEAIYDAQLRGEVTTRQDALDMAHSLASETENS